MKLNLRDARRLERDIQAVQTKLAGSINVGHKQVSIHEDFDTAVTAVQTKLGTILGDAVSLNTIRFKLRKQIETQNEVAGLNALMNEEAQLKDQVKSFSIIADNQLTDSEFNIAKARHAALKAVGPTAPQYGRTVDYVELDGVVTEESAAHLAGEIKAAQKRIHRIVTELGALNSSTLVELSDEDIARLEQHDIVV